MNISVVLHGVPYGQDVSDSVFGVAVQPYYSRVSKAPDEEFECVVRQVKDDSRVLYTLTLNNNVVDAENRSGSYFGLTVAMTDYYFTKVRYLYELMKIAVERFAIGKVISLDKGTYKFIVKNLRDQQQIAKSVQDFILGELKSAMGQDNILPISSLNSKSNQTSNMNWVDATDSELAKCMKSIGRFCVSSQFDSMLVKNARQQLANEKEAFQKNLQEQDRQMREAIDKERKEMQQAMAENERKCNDQQQRCEREKEELKRQKEKDIESLQKELERLKSEKASLVEEKEKLKTENKNLSSKGDVRVIANTVGQLENVVKELKNQRDYMTQRHSNAKEKPSMMERIIKIVFRLLPVMLLLILLIVQLQNNKRVKTILDRLEVVEQFDGRIEALKDEVMNLPKILSSTVSQTDDEISANMQNESSAIDEKTLGTVGQTENVTPKTNLQSNESLPSLNVEKPKKKGFFERLFSVFRRNK